MAFKLVEKSSGMRGINENEVSINNYGMSFGSSVSKRFNGFESCELYLDKENRKVGLKPSNNSLTGFKVATAVGGQERKSISGSWARRLPKRRFQTTYDGDMIILNDCDIADNKPKTKFQ